MATIRGQRIRAKITIDGLASSVETPNVVSFNVSRSRGQMSATFSASIKVSHSDIDNLVNTTILIEAGTLDGGGLRPIFTGTIERIVVNPVRTDASKVMLNLSGRDVLSILEGQKVNRRVTTYRNGDNPPERWGAVTEVLRHNTARLERLPVKVNNNTEKAVQELPQNTLDQTPKLFGLKQTLDSALPKKTFGAIEVTKIASSTTSQDGG